MKKLAEKEYWDSIYKKDFDKKGGSSFKDWVKNQTRDFSNYIIWEYLLPLYLPQNKYFKIIEIGCAPGKYLLNFKKMFGYEPFGVEYSEKGFEITRKNFSMAGINPDNIILADFFDENFQSQNAGKYDVVFSRGFIEHFDDVKKVVGFHSNLLKKGGYLIIMIPNLSGLNNFLAKILNRQSYDLHNTRIMNKKTFSDLFDENEFDKIYADYSGIFSFGLFNTNSKWKYYLHRLLLLIQRPFDFLFRITKINIKNKNTSPYLLFIGKKRQD